MANDNHPHERKTKRRRFLQTVGAAGTVGLAGCTSDTGDGSDGGSDDGNGDGSGNGQDSTEEEQSVDFPDRDMRVIIPFSAGGGYDFYARALAKHLPDHLPEEVNVQAQNVTGAEGRIALQELANADPDGHTISIMHVQRFTQQTHLYDEDYDLREFTWLPTITEEFDSIAIADHVDIDSWDDFVEGIQNEELIEASTGPTSGGTVSMITLGQVTGLWDSDAILDNQVITDGTGDSISLLIGGDADYINGSYSSILPYVESGDLTPIMFYNLDDSIPPEAPDWAETLGTADIDNAQAVRDITMTVRSFAGPPDIPDDVHETLSQSISDAIQSDDLQAEAEENERPIVYRDAESTEELVHGAIEAWGEQEELLETLAND